MKLTVNGTIVGLAVVAGLLMHLPKVNANEFRECKAIAQSSSEYKAAEAQETQFLAVVAMNKIYTRQIQGKLPIIKGNFDGAVMFNNSTAPAVAQYQEYQNAVSDVYTLANDFDSLNRDFKAYILDVQNGATAECIASNHHWIQKAEQRGIEIITRIRQDEAWLKSVSVGTGLFR